MCKNGSSPVSFCIIPFVLPGYKADYSFPSLKPYFLMVPDVFFVLDEALEEHEVNFSLSSPPHCLRGMGAD